MFDQDDLDLNGQNYDEPSDEELEALDQKREQLEQQEQAVAQSIALQPMFQTLFELSVEPGDRVLEDFARCVVGPLSDYFGMEAAKGGAFFQQKEAEGAKNTERYSRDQTLRAHLINGMLPARRIASLLQRWGAQPLRHWDETVERLFIAGYMLHDFTKIKAAKQTLIDAGFKEMEAPSDRQIPYLETIFLEWGRILGLDPFLEPVGGLEYLLHDVIYVACNTQRYSGTIHAPTLLPRTMTEASAYKLATNISTLADLMAYVARTPRELVVHESINDALRRLWLNLAPTFQVASLVYHHVAENRGLLLNFIHDAALKALEEEDQRVALLFAPSGVVYLERHDAPPMPAPDALVDQIVGQIRARAGDKLISTGKGAKRGNTGLQVDDSYNDFFDLRDMVLKSVDLVERHIRSNKSQARLTAVEAENWAGESEFPHVSTVPGDTRLDQMAEWAGLLENQFRDRLPTFDITSFLLYEWAIEDLRTQFDAVRNHPKALKGGGIKFWWFWAAAHALQRKSGVKDPDAISTWLRTISQRLVSALPGDLPVSAQASDETWRNLSDYVARVLTLGGTKAEPGSAANELERYTRAKAGRGGAVCAICGSSYTTRKPAETAVAFQPGVYSARIKIGASDNKRNLCSICALEQLLRQLFVENLDSGSTAEGQRIRYLSFYPSYFFTPETLRFMRRVYGLLKDVRLSDKELRRALNAQATRLKDVSMQGHPLRDVTFWQRLDPFLLRAESEDPSRRVVRYSEEAISTFLMVGFRSFNDPSDTESWVLPAWFALTLPICLDVKVIASEGGTPLMLEADELRETVWYDGAHAAIQALLGDDRLDIDQMQDALARLTAAYLIHLDTEYQPPKENWHRLAPIAHALTESPWYVLYYLKKQERDGHLVGDERVRRYLAFAEMIFTRKGDNAMSLARKLVEQYRGFYRARTPLNPNRMRRPLDVVAETLLKADPRLFPDAQSLEEAAYGELKRFMDRVGKGLADGRFPKGISAEARDAAMQTFCKTFVEEVFIDIFDRDVAALRGKQLNLLSSTCEALYRQMQLEEWAQRGRDEDENETDEDQIESA
ncbi:MAG: type I-D CRISPR-associated protein Cas10d/Csc3 [Anaerolineae bacterium]|nr:type I-D CRISPR-associated protein Cas10d/Csc3 [Anaerolineae bacterium]